MQELSEPTLTDEAEDSNFPTDPLPIDPFPSPAAEPSTEPVIGPAPEELNPDFITESIPETYLETPLPSPAPSITENVVLPEAGYYLPDLANPLDPFFQMDGLKVRIGEVHIRLPVGISSQYDDNIFQSNTDTTSDLITAISPTLLLGIGDYAIRQESFFSLRYTPQFQYFLENSELNTTNELFNADGQYSFRRLTTTGSLSFSRSSNPTSTDQGRRERTRYSFSLGNSYAVGAKTFLEADLGANYQDDGSNIEYTTVTLSPRLAYQFSPKLRLGLGPVLGVVYVSDGGQQTFQGLVLNVNYDTLERFKFSGSLGVQARQFDDDSADNEDFVTPTFAFGTSYKIGDDGLRIASLDLSRTVGNSSFLRGQSVINNSVRFSYRQPILSRFSFAIALRYQVNEYQGEDGDTDAFVSARPSIGYYFYRDQIELSLFYDRSERTSEIARREFQNNVFGLNLNLQF